MQKNVLVPLARGFEEIELISIVDVLRRADVRVALASLDTHKRVLGTHKVVIEADCALPSEEMSHYDAIALAGGYNGMLNLANNELITQWLQHFKQEQKLIAAICASPIVLDKAGVLEGDFTCYPSCEEQINLNGKTYLNRAVVVSQNGKLITSAAPATAAVFALAIVRELCGDEVANRLYNELQLPLLKEFLA